PAAALSAKHAPKLLPERRFRRLCSLEYFVRPRELEDIELIDSDLDQDIRLPIPEPLAGDRLLQDLDRLHDHLDRGRTRADISLGGLRVDVDGDGYIGCS